MQHPEVKTTPQEACECMEDKLENAVTDPAKAKILAGPDGMRHSGPWKAAYDQCILPGLYGAPAQETSP